MDCLTILNASNCDVGGFICPKSPHVTQILNSSFLLLGPSASLLTSIVLAPSTPEASTLSCALSSLCLKHILLKNECQLKRLNSSGLLTEYNRKCHLNCHKQMRYFISNVSRGVGYRHVVRQAELDRSSLGNSLFHICPEISLKMISRLPQNHQFYRKKISLLLFLCWLWLGLKVFLYSFCSSGFVFG